MHLHVSAINLPVVRDYTIAYGNGISTGLVVKPKSGRKFISIMP